jgi:hypothetical protein
MLVSEGLDAIIEEWTSKDSKEGKASCGCNSRTRNDGGSPIGSSGSKKDEHSFFQSVATAHAYHIAL